MLEQSHEFGPELRRRRLAARLSLQQLGMRVHYSKSQLSKVERGMKRPTPELARLCDAELRAGGELARLVVAARPSRPPLPVPGVPGVPDPAPDSDDEVWLMRLRKDGTSSFQPVTRRGLIAAGAATVLTARTGTPTASYPPNEPQPYPFPVHAPLPVHEAAETLVDASRLLFDQFRRLGQASDPAAVLPPLIAQAHALEQLAARSGSRTRRALLRLASRYAEYAGWMAQEGGDDTTALWWTERAVRLADAGADPGLATYAQVRRSLICLYRGATAEASELATHALESDAHPRIRGLAAQHLAQSTAVAGDHGTAMRSLDRARELLAADAADRDADDPGQPVLGASHLPDVVSMYTGWCLYDLGRPRQAAALLDEETARIPEHAFRTRARHGVRQALAHAAAGDIDRACEVASGVLPAVRLTHMLTRPARHASIRTLLPI
ncbi:helix-turn-helix domain protein [Actinobacteria bacterium OK074]|nr:helix-turn-helix domain protein [Actinobacteria bacterium OK074]